MKNTIYIGILIFIFIASAVSISLYYSQNFKEDIVINTQLSFDTINYTSSYDSYQNTNNLLSATAKLGKVSLNNEGFFPKVYEFPILVGCIKVNESADVDVVNRLNDFQFKVEYRDSENGATYYSNDQVSREIQVGNKKEFTILGSYSGYNSIPVSYFAKGNIAGIQIYEFPSKEQNPLSDSMQYPIYYSDYGLCSGDRNRMNLLKTISLN